MQVDNSKLQEVIESILFVSGQAVELDDIAQKLDVPKADVRFAIDKLKEKHQNSGINVITFKNSAQLCSNPEFAEDIAAVLNPIKEKLLTKAALETLAIVAYKQPITRLEIEQVRGVNSDYAMQILQSFNLVEVVGRKDAIGKPLLFGTTNEFLKRFELENINDLPDYDELLERIEVLHADNSLYRSSEIVPEDQLKSSQNNQNDNLDATTQASLANNSDGEVENNFDAPQPPNRPNLPKFDEEYIKQTLIDAGSDVIASKDEDFL